VSGAGLVVSGKQKTVSAGGYFCMAKGSLKLGEKILFGIVALIGVFAVTSYVMLEVLRAHSDKPLYPVTDHFDFSAEGLTGSVIFRKQQCTSCHKAVRNGTNMGLDLDGIGSKRSFQYLYNFLKNPEATYAAATIDHGPAPKEAAYVSKLPEADLHALAVFLSELKASQGSADSPLPPPGRSGFIDDMVKVWAPSSWKSEFTDVRKEEKKSDK
jgi:cytochrome c553